MASGVISEGVLIIASVIIAGMITGIVISKVGTFEGIYTATTEAQKEIGIGSLHSRQPIAVINVLYLFFYLL